MRVAGDRETPLVAEEEARYGLEIRRSFEAGDEDITLF